MIANMSIEPIITVYVATLIDDPKRLIFMAGLVTSATALGSIISASKLGKPADRTGRTTVIILALLVAGVLLLPQAFVTSAWQLVGLSFAMGLALGGLVPCIAAVVQPIFQTFRGRPDFVQLRKQYSQKSCDVSRISFP